ncbi:MAG: hypothetical protein ACRD63_04290 [Pyrinomonadaceae bacterium]
MAVSRIEAILAQAKYLSSDELAQLIKQVADLLVQSRKTSIRQTPRYASLFGSGKGVFVTPEEADQFVREERDAWDV